MGALESMAASAPDPALASSPAHNLLSKQPLLFLASYLKYIYFPSHSYGSTAREFPYSKTSECWSDDLLIFEV